MWGINGKPFPLDSSFCLLCCPLYKWIYWKINFPTLCFFVEIKEKVHVNILNCPISQEKKGETQIRQNSNDNLEFTQRFSESLFMPFSAYSSNLEEINTTQPNWWMSHLYLTSIHILISAFDCAYRVNHLQLVCCLQSTMCFHTLSNVRLTNYQGMLVSASLNREVR